MKKVLTATPRLSSGRRALEWRAQCEFENLHLIRSILIPPNSLSQRRSQPTLRRFSATSTTRSRSIEKDSRLESEHSLSHEIRLLMRRIPHPVAIVTAYSSSSSSSATSKPGPGPRGMTVSSFNTVTLHPKPTISFNVRKHSETLSALRSSGRFLVHMLSPTNSMARLARNFSKGNVNLELDQFEFVDCYNYNNTANKIGGDAITEGSGGGNGSGSGSISKLPRLNRRRNDDREQMMYNRQTNNETQKPAAAEATITTKKEEVEEEDFIFILECKYLPDKSIEVYDNMIVLGNVEGIISPRSTSTPVSDLEDLEQQQQQHQQRRRTRHTRGDFSLMYADTRFWNMGDEV